MVWVWQLRGRKVVDAANYQTLLRKADTVLKDEVLASKELPVMPGGSVTLNMLMDEDAQFPAGAAGIHPAVRRISEPVRAGGGGAGPAQPRAGRT